MAKLSVNEIMVQVASTVNQEATAPTAGGSEYNLWLQYLNRGVFEWANTNNWEALRKRFYPTVIGTSQATVSLPGDFRQIAGPPILYNGTSTTGISYPESLPEQRGERQENEYYYEQWGDLSTGFSLIFSPGTLASGASLAIEYFSMPTSLASPAQYPMVPDSQFLVDRTIAYIFEARSDSRFQTEEQKARERLLGMVETADMAKFNSYSNPNYIQTTEKRMGFRVGRD